MHGNVGDRAPRRKPIAEHRHAAAWEGGVIDT
jgi:hypothetical protein